MQRATRECASSHDRRATPGPLINDNNAAAAAAAAAATNKKKKKKKKNDNSNNTNHAQCLCPTRRFAPPAAEAC